MSKNKEAYLITAEEFSLSTDNVMQSEQLKTIFSKTPSSHVFTRPGKGGKPFEYVTGVYMKKRLNQLFGWNWDFEIENEIIQHGQCIVKGKLTCRSGEHTIVKMQYGRADIKFKRDTKDPVDLGNDLKAAATDCLKKCASEIGIASDIYGKNEFKELQIVDADEKEIIVELLMKIEECEQLSDLDAIVKSTDKTILSNTQVRNAFTAKKNELK